MELNWADAIRFAFVFMFTVVYVAYVVVLSHEAGYDRGVAVGELNREREAIMLGFGRSDRGRFVWRGRECD